jgi:hypothetical protein
MVEEAGAFLGGEAVHEGSECFPKRLHRSDRFGAQQRLQFGKCHFECIVMLPLYAGFLWGLGLTSLLDFSWSNSASVICTSQMR